MNKAFIVLLMVGIFLTCVTAAKKSGSPSCNKKKAPCEILEILKQPAEPVPCNVDFTPVLEAISKLGDAAAEARRALKENLDQKFDQQGKDVVNGVVEALVALHPTHPPTTQPPPPKEYKTCSEIYADGERENKAYDLSLAGGKIPVYCHMDAIQGCGSGGFTLVMKIDGNKKTFIYDSELWTNDAVFNAVGGSSGLNDEETKLPTYSQTPFSKICLGMKVGGQTKFLSLDNPAESLHSLIAGNEFRAFQTPRGRDAWKALIGSDASLQQNCNREGFNAKANDNMSKARIGISSNNENSCDSNDSRIGFGTGGYPNDNVSCGDEAKHGGDNGDKNIAAVGYILVQ